VPVDDGRANTQRAIACTKIGFPSSERADVGEGAVELLEFELLRYRDGELRRAVRAEVHQLRRPGNGAVAAVHC